MSCQKKEFETVFDINIIRGQGYYTTSVFEVYADGFDGAVGGGGRYDEMIQKISNKEVPAVGFSLGFERLFLIIDVDKIIAELVALIYEEKDSFFRCFKISR